MYIVAAFEQNIFIEMALAALEQEGVKKEQLMAVPLDIRNRQRGFGDTLHRSDGVSLFDWAAVLGTCFMLLGAIYGYILPWGPIIWGIIGALFGCGSGFLIKWIYLRKKHHLNGGSRSVVPTAILLIHCEACDKKRVEQILWDHKAAGLSSLDIK